MALVLSMRLSMLRRGARVVAGNPSSYHRIATVPVVLFYRHIGDGDPARLVRRALGEALVPDHLLAGRLREVEGRKLVVDCTGEGVLFVEADADVRLAELEAAGLRPPFPYVDQLLCDLARQSVDAALLPVLGGGDRYK
nr:unnamed protein product [Digitaria exilis]